MGLRAADLADSVLGRLTTDAKPHRGFTACSLNGEAIATGGPEVVPDTKLDPRSCIVAVAMKIRPPGKLQLALVAVTHVPHGTSTSHPPDNLDEELARDERIMTSLHKTPKP